MKKFVENKGDKLIIWLENIRTVTMHGRAPNAKFRVECDKDGQPLHKETRRRVFDGDFVPFKVEVDKPKKTTKTKTTKPKKTESDINNNIIED